MGYNTLEYRGVFSTAGDIMINLRDILSVVEMFSAMGDIMSTVGDIIFCNLIKKSMAQSGSSTEIGSSMTFTFVSHLGVNFAVMFFEARQK